MKTFAMLLASTLVAVALVGCTPAGATGLGERLEVVNHVTYYPACGNELLEWDGTTYYPFVPDDDGDFPEPLALAGGVGARPGELARVIAPGPGDDVGTLVIYANGYAFFRSNSGDLSTWLTTEPRVYDWVC